MSRFNPRVIITALAGVLGIAVTRSSSGPSSSAPRKRSSLHPMVQAALSAEDLSYGDPERRMSYARFLYPYDLQVYQLDMARTHSSCLTFAGACMREAGVQAPELHSPYQPVQGTIEAMLYKVALRLGILAMHRSTKEPAIEPGDIVVIGMGGKPPGDPDSPERASWLAEWGGIAHGLVVIDRQGNDIFSIDGGQLDPMNMGKSTLICRRLRTLMHRHNGYWLANRKVNYVIRTSKLGQRTV